jgi:hypothetical protein
MGSRHTLVADTIVWHRLAHSTPIVVYAFQQTAVQGLLLFACI